jgi:hypothetical protein
MKKVSKSSTSISRNKYFYSVSEIITDAAGAKDSEASEVFLYPKRIIVPNTTTPTTRLLQRILRTYLPNRGLQNFFASPILIAVLVTSAIIIAIVAVRDVSACAQSADFSDISCVIASTSAKPDKNDIR